MTIEYCVEMIRVKGHNQVCDQGTTVHAPRNEYSMSGPLGCIARVRLRWYHPGNTWLLIFIFEVEVAADVLSAPQS
jgi:hypothetical protein